MAGQSRRQPAYRVAKCDAGHATETDSNCVLTLSNQPVAPAQTPESAPRRLPVTRITVNEAVCEALFASQLQPSDTLTAETIADAIGSTVRRLGAAGCSSHMAQEFGDHPEEATRRMRWIRQLTSDLCGCLYFATAVPPVTAAAGTGLLPVLEAA
jgi:hypothetical protein